MACHEQPLSGAGCPLHDVPVPEDSPDDATVIMEVLFDIRRNTDYIIELLEEDDGEEEAAEDS
jgi:hypothetical protein